MGRKAIYSSAAERTRAYRARLEQQHPELIPEPRPAKPARKKAAPKPLSRQKQLDTAMEMLETLREGLEDWRGNLPENLQGSALADKLETAIDSLTNALDELGNVDMPLGFGRD